MAPGPPAGEHAGSRSCCSMVNRCSHSGGGSAIVAGVFGFGVVEQLMTDGAGAVASDVGSCPSGELLDAVAVLKRIRRLVDACETQLVGEIDAQQASEAEVGLTTPVWLASSRAWRVG